MNKRISAFGLAALFLFSLVPKAGAFRAGYRSRLDPKNNAIVYTIRSDAEDVVEINCDNTASTLLRRTKVPGQDSTVCLRFVNDSKKTYYFEHVEFRTENGISRDVSADDPALPAEGTLRLSCPRDTGSVGGTVGFDGKRIPYSMNVLRSINEPLKRLYGRGLHAYDMTVRQVAVADDAAQAKGYASYSDYLLQYYKKHCSRCAGAKHLWELEPKHLTEIFGTREYGDDGQSAIRQPRSLSRDELQTGKYEKLRRYGWASNKKAGKQDVYGQGFEMLETDPELIRLGYWFLYQYGMFFTFDADRYSLAQDTAQEDYADGLQIAEYLNMQGRAAQCTADAFSGMKLAPGEEFALDKVAFSEQLPNSYNHRSFDFGFSVFLSTKEPVNPPEPPGPGPHPKPDPNPDPGTDPDPDPNPTPHPDPSPAPDPEPTPDPAPQGPSAPDPTPDTPTTLDKPSDKGSGSPQTGEDPTALYALGGMALFAIGIFIFWRKLRRKEDDR